MEKSAEVQEKKRDRRAPLEAKSAQVRESKRDRSKKEARAGKLEGWRVERKEVRGEFCMGIRKNSKHRGAW